MCDLVIRASKTQLLAMNVRCRLAGDGGKICCNLAPFIRCERPLSLDIRQPIELGFMRSERYPRV